MEKYKLIYLQIVFILFFYMLCGQVIGQTTAEKNNAPMPEKIILLNVSVGTVQRHEIKSTYVDSRFVDVWLPSGYNTSQKYDVLYMHDGQMLFDSTTTWNKQAWNVQEVITQLMAQKKINPTLVVGIHNNGNKRHTEYFPQKALAFIPDSIRTELEKLFVGKPKADDYLKFLVTELKPFIDKTYSTKTKQKNTFIAGSSMGGLISMYALCEYPKIFAGAGCLSIHWIGLRRDNAEIPAAFYKYMAKNLPKPKKNKFYFDYGSIGLDAMYGKYQKNIDQLMPLQGYDAKNWQTLFFENTDHSEKAWAKRLATPLLFLMQK
jgi:predicted alpha/beta superfamily hydrolase